MSTHLIPPDGAVRRGTLAGAAGIATAVTLTLVGQPLAAADPLLPDLHEMAVAGDQIGTAIDSVLTPLGTAYNAVAGALGLDVVPIRHTPPELGIGDVTFTKTGPLVVFDNFVITSPSQQIGTWAVGGGATGPSHSVGLVAVGVQVTNTNGPNGSTTVLPYLKSLAQTDAVGSSTTGVIFAPSPGSVSIGTNTIGVAGPYLPLPAGVQTPYGSVAVTASAGGVKVDPVNGVTVTGPSFTVAVRDQASHEVAGFGVSTGTVNAGPRGASVTGTEVDANAGGPTGTTVATGASAGVDFTPGGNGVWGSGGVQASSGGPNSPVNVGEIISTGNGAVAGGGAAGIDSNGNPAGDNTRTDGSDGFHSAN